MICPSSMKAAVHHYNGRALFFFPRIPRGLNYLLKTVPVDILHIPPEGTEFSADVTQIVYVLCVAVELLAVIIYKSGQIAHLLLSGKKRGLPYLAFLALTVPYYQVDHALFTVKTMTQR